MQKVERMRMGDGLSILWCLQARVRVVSRIFVGSLCLRKKVAAGVRLSCVP